MEAVGGHTSVNACIHINLGLSCEQGQLYLSQSLWSKCSSEHVTSVVIRYMNRTFYLAPLGQGLRSFNSNVKHVNIEKHCRGTTCVRLLHATVRECNSPYWCKWSHHIHWHCVILCWECWARSAKMQWEALIWKEIFSRFRVVMR